MKRKRDSGEYMKRSINLSNNYDSDENISPMDNISNMSDAMLVLAVGIMLALVINWNIDINVSSSHNTGETVNESEFQEYEFEDENQDTQVSIEDVESNYVKSGTVYTDTVTGKTYVVID